MIIGIDLGTTNSVAARMTDDGPVLIPNALGEVLTPSVVGIDEQGSLLVGQAAREYQVLQPERCAALFKRHMGSDWNFEVDGKSFTPEQLSSLVLRTLKEDAEAHFEESIERAVITVPAYFNDLQRKATIHAGDLAGLQVDRIINEPTAAAIAYGFHETQDDKTVVVFDLGGGTFDVSVVELFEGTIEVRASSGESFLGGEDFTKTMASRVLQSHGMMFERAELDAPAMVSRVLQQCERAKRLLSSRASTQIRMPNKSGEITDDAAKVEISRQQFDEWTQHVLAGIDLPIRRGLGDANLKRNDIDEVVLVGGATRMPAVVQRVGEIFQQPPHSRLNPDEVVALGAAVQAGLIEQRKSLDEMVVTDVAPFTMGIEITRRIGTQYKGGYYLPIINRNTTIPASRVERVQTLQSNQTSVAVEIYQGECRKVKDNLLLGKFEVKGVPRGPAGQSVDVRFTYDLNGVLEIEAEIVETKKKSRLIITKHAHGLSDRQVNLAVEQMQDLKTHPREETENRFLLKRAERVYQELPLSEREFLADLIDGFEDALEMQEEDLIDRHRDNLREFLDRFEDSFGDEPADDDEQW